MVRASQGLQVLLIIFVMLTVVLGVTTYLYNKRADEATKAAVVEKDAKTKVQGDLDTKQKECDRLKKWIGYADQATDDIQKHFDEDMQTYGNAKKTDADNKAGGDAAVLDSYANVLKSLAKVIQDRSDDVIRARELYAQLDTKYQNREKNHIDAMNTLTANYDTLNGTVKKIADEFGEKQKATDAEIVRDTQAVSKIKTEAEKVANAAVEEKKAAEAQVRKKEKDIKDILDKQEKVTRQEMDVPSGEITWVSLPNKLVWINRGRSDDLPRQTKFTVYSAGSNSGAAAVKKGTIEVVRIEGDHSAQCRILTDILADPMMTGDKVFTPLWSPGQRNHFALTGIMNLDGDGRNQLGTVQRLINENGGAVDCWLDETGHKQGQITANTRYIVVGDAPDKSSADFLKNHGDILRDADRYRVQTMKLSDFKQQMGYEKSSSVEYFGRGGAPSDAARPAAAPKAPKSKAADESEK